MRHLLIAICCSALFAGTSSAQNILNGSFEDNLVATDSLHLQDPAFDNSVANCYAIDGGSMDVISSTTYCGSAADGDFFIQNTMSEYYGAFSMKMDIPLTIGWPYSISFRSRNCSGSSSSIVIGYTEFDSIIGTPIFTINPSMDSVWTLHDTIFTPTSAFNYMYVDIQNGSLDNRVQVDDFILISFLPISEQNNEIVIHSGPNPVMNQWSIELAQAGTLEWVNSLGQVVVRTPLAAGSNTIERKDLSAGIYSYTIILTDGGMASGKLILR